MRLTLLFGLGVDSIELGSEGEEELDLSVCKLNHRLAKECMQIHRIPGRSWQKKLRPSGPASSSIRL